MTLLNEVDKPGSDVEVYARGLDRVLLKKIQIITDLRERLLTFFSHLKTEEHMSKLYERNQERAQQTMADSDQDIENTYDHHPQFKAATSSGNLVDDILNGAYNDGGQHDADSLLEEEEQQLHEQDDFDHLN